MSWMYDYIRAKEAGYNVVAAVVEKEGLLGCGITEIPRTYVPSSNNSENNKNEVEKKPKKEKSKEEKSSSSVKTIRRFVDLLK